MRPTGPRGGISIVKVVVLVAIALLLGGGGFFAMGRLRGGGEGGRAEAAGESSVQEQPEPATETLSLGEFLVNLRSADGTLRYLQTEISIVVLAPVEEAADASGRGAGHGAGSGANNRNAELPAAGHRYARDVAIEVLSSESFEHLRDQADRSKLKARLQQKLDEALEEYEVEDVLFTAFVMQ